MRKTLLVCLGVIGLTAAAHGQELARDEEQADSRPPRRLGIGLKF